MVAQANYQAVGHVTDDPSDLVQEALVKACKAATSFKGTTEGEYLAWLKRILGNIFLDSYRKRHRRKAPQAFGVADIDDGWQSR